MFSNVVLKRSLSKLLPGLRYSELSTYSGVQQPKLQQLLVQVMELNALLVRSYDVLRRDLSFNEISSIRTGSFAGLGNLDSLYVITSIFPRM